MNNLRKDRDLTSPYKFTTELPSHQGFGDFKDAS
jgi:hypothetical protein